MLTHQHVRKDFILKEVKSTKKKRKLPYIIVGIITALIIIIPIIIFSIGNYLLEYAIGRNGDGGDREVALEVTSTDGVDKKIEEGRIAQKELTSKFLASVKEEEVGIKSDDNLNLKGYYYENNNNSHKWALLIHGYRSDHKGMQGTGQRYNEKGHQVLIPDLRGCGDSEGDYIGMGWLDKNDILKWIDWINKKDPQAQIVIQGVSMGAATTMMTAGENTPDSVKAFVEDCGYTSVWDVFSSELKLRFKLPSFPILNSASILSGQKAGYDFIDASSINQLKKAEKPMLFIHGTADDFIPFYMEKELYDAKPGDNKKMIVAEGAGHAESSYLLGDEYWNSVFDFVDNYVK